MTVSSQLRNTFEEDRIDARQDFLKSNNLEKESLIPLACDASRRCYFRLPSALLMDDPSQNEDTLQFTLISKLLNDAGLSAPRVYTADHEAGFLLIEDWGDTTYRSALASGVPEKTLYSETIHSLIKLHKNISENAHHVPPYDYELFMEKACLFVDWYEKPFSPQEKLEFKRLWEKAFENQPDIPCSLALRDVMVDNLMWLSDREGHKRSGFIDFQDATWTPVTYDLFSLLQDARRDVNTIMAEELIDLYLSNFSLNRDDFFASYALWGAQRTARILGVFYRLAKRDSKPQYLQYIPRLKKSLEYCLAHPSLRDLKEWFSEVGL